MKATRLTTPRNSGRGSPTKPDMVWIGSKASNSLCSLWEIKAMPTSLKLGERQTGSWKSTVPPESMISVLEMTKKAMLLNTSKNGKRPSGTRFPNSFQQQEILQQILYSTNRKVSNSHASS